MRCHRCVGWQPGRYAPSSNYRSACRPPWLRRNGRIKSNGCAGQLYPWPRLLLLGAGPDTVPLLELARTLGWEVSVADHRQHYIDALPADLADHVHIVDPAQLGKQLALEQYTAVVVMSHHLDTDRHYIRQLAQYQHSYVGLLGPTARKLRLLEELGLADSDFGKRLHGPVGLAIGADTPATIALAVLAEIQLLLHELR